MSSSKKSGELRNNYYPCEVRVLPSEDEEISTQHKSTWTHLWRDFVSSTTLHGIRFIFYHETYILRRLLWTLLMLFCITLMSYQIIDRILYLHSNPVNVNVKINYNQSLTFPAVTICNQNAFKATTAAKRKWYRLIETMYNGSSKFFSQKDLDRFHASNLTFNQFFQQASHRKEDLIVSCQWADLPCGPQNFTEQLTDYGNCYRFVAPENARSTGADNGLKLLLNVEQYEYMPGPNDAAGVKVLTHVQNDHPRVRELGIAVPTGTQAFIGLQVILVQNLEIPHGQCQYKSLKFFPNYSYDSCLVECYTEVSSRHCGCRDYYMPSINGFPPPCNLEQYFTCLKPLYDDFSLWLESCNCPTDCDYTVYDPVMSYATTSEYAGQRFMDKINVTTLNSKLKRAREITHRMDARKLETFKEKVKQMEQTFIDVKQLIEETIQKRILNQIRNVTEHYTSAIRVTNRRILLLRFQIYNVQKNFMRGRDAMEERTLSHLCNSFHEFVFAYETNLRNLITENDMAIRRTFYVSTINMVDIRTENAKRALANFTVLYDAYVTGTPIFRYKFQKFARRYNNYVVPRPLLNESTYHNAYARGYSGKLGDDILSIMEALSNYRNLTWEVFTDATLNITKMNLVSGNFIDACERFYHTKSTLYYETVDRPERILKKRLEHTEKQKADLIRIKSSMLNTLHDLQNTSTAVRGDVLVRMESILQATLAYFRYSNRSKISVSNLFHSSEFMSDVSQLRQFLQEIATRGALLFDRWPSLATKVIHIWRDIINDRDLKEYYEFKNYTNFLRDVEDVRNKIERSFRHVRAEDDLRFVVGNKDVLLFEAVENLRTELLKFQRSTIFDENVLKDNFLELNIFYRQLSYEEITQQEAYDIFALLCDIGGSLGLFIGASVMTLFELFDLFGTYIADSKMRSKKP
ncbi:uncharacterized protein LOC133206334 [Saccostrea echinata]|uniref:uncharacterized protein LOC133206334 n=1 Tax=Saccostrea echinata TaxID=191078 RepID=UPI002A7FA344|nr:uncharacterized protein LOC133206334 [Saccostrea echinata]